MRNVSNNDAEVYTEIFRHIWKIQIDTDFSTSVSAERLACVSITGDRTKNILSVKIRQTKGMQRKICTRHKNTTMKSKYEGKKPPSFKNNPWFNYQAAISFIILIQEFVYT